MIPFLKELNLEFKKICKESYLEVNSSSKVIYPYVTYSYFSESLENTREGFYIDVDIWDNKGSDTLRLEQLTEDIRKHFIRNRILTDKVLLQFKVGSRKIITTGLENIKRRNLQLYCKIDWR